MSVVTTEKNGESNCVVPGPEKSHQPLGSPVRKYKDGAKNLTGRGQAVQRKARKMTYNG